MMCMVVNEFVEGGLLQFLKTLKMQEQKKFDRRKHLALCDPGAADHLVKQKIGAAVDEASGQETAEGEKMAARLEAKVEATRREEEEVGSTRQQAEAKVAEAAEMAGT
eukprot:4699513-Prymnesium_polylepis.1